MHELFLPVVGPCLQNDPTMRPTSIQLVTQMRGIEESHPRRVEDSTVIPQLCQDLRPKDEHICEKLKENAYLREDLEALRKVRDYHRQEVGWVRRNLHLSKQEIDRLRSKSSPVTQVGIGMGIMFVVLVSKLSPEMHVVVYNV